MTTIRSDGGMLSSSGVSREPPPPPDRIPPTMNIPRKVLVEILALEETNKNELNVKIKTATGQSEEWVQWVKPGPLGKEWMTWRKEFDNFLRPLLSISDRPLSINLEGHAQSGSYGTESKPAMHEHKNPLMEKGHPPLSKGHDDFKSTLTAVHEQLTHVKTALHIASEYGDQAKLQIAVDELEKAHEAFLPVTLNNSLHLRETRLRNVIDALREIIKALNARIDKLDKSIQDLNARIEKQDKPSEDVQARKDIIVAKVEELKQLRMNTLNQLGLGEGRKKEKKVAEVEELKQLRMNTQNQLGLAEGRLSKLNSHRMRIFNTTLTNREEAVHKDHAPENTIFSRYVSETKQWKLVEKIERILEEGLNSTDDNWSTPLHKAAENDYPLCVKDLIEAGANISARDKEGQTALHLAAKNGCIESVKLLMKAGSEWDEVHEKERDEEDWPLYHNIIDYEGNTALHLAVNWKGDMKDLLEATVTRLQIRLPHILNQSEVQDCEEGDEVEVMFVDGAKTNWLPGKIVRVGNDEDPFGKCYKVECDKGRELLKILLESDKTDPEAIKEHKSAMDKRNYDGCTPCVNAALKGLDDNMSYLIKVHEAKFKVGSLHHNDREYRFKILLAASSLFGLALGIWLMVYFLRDHTIINTRNHHCDYYYIDNEGEGILLEPNMSLFLSVFVFSAVESGFVTSFLPACHFVQHYISHRFCCCSKQLGGEKKPMRNESWKEPTNCYGYFDPEYVWSQIFDPSKIILKDWRIQKYKSLRYSHELYGGYEFSYQTEMIWYYLQVLYAMVDFVRICVDVFATRKFTGFTPLQVYVRFYGRVVNSSCLSAAFSLFQLLIFGRRQSQFLHAHRIFASRLGPFWGSWVVGPFWLFCVTFPAIVLIPPLFSHVPPGVVLFPWLWICVLVSYWVIGIEGYRYLFPENEEKLDKWLAAIHEKHAENVGKQHEEKIENEDIDKVAKDSCCRQISHCCRRLFSWEDDVEIAERNTLSNKSHSGEENFHSPFQRSSSKKKGSSKKKDDTRRSQHVVTDAELGKYHLRLLEDPRLMLLRHLYWMLLQILARFAFMIFFQVLYDYVSLSVYPGEQRPFSERYANAYSTAFSLRSQSNCYLRIMSQSTSNFMRVPVGSALSSSE